MSKELEDLEIEIKRTQLRREQLALQDELAKRERRDGAREAARATGEKVVAGAEVAARTTLSGARRGSVVFVAGGCGFCRLVYLEGGHPRARRSYRPAGQCHHGLDDFSVCWLPCATSH